MRRATLIAVVGSAVVLLAGCGGRGEGAPAPLERVRLQVTAPSDGALVRGGTVDVRGRVTPSTAQVVVLGRPALVADGRFTVVVPLQPGVNVVDIAASARRRTAAFAALRVTRDVLVSVPDLTGVEEDDLDARLEDSGLRASVERGGGLLDALLPGARAVCEQEPAPGTRVRRGRTVRVLVTRRC